MYGATSVCRCVKAESGLLTAGDKLRNSDIGGEEVPVNS
ncbi:hypothetical protein PF010_g32326, partial [Phytophthora fragariae]